jgi:acyl-CoA thioesterase FadM
MSAMVKRWPVLHEHPVTADDLDVDGIVGDESVARWIETARAAYLERCSVLQRMLDGSGLQPLARTIHQPPGASLGRPQTVVVSAGVTEIDPGSFTIAVRLRPIGGDRDTAVNASCLIRLQDPTTGTPHEITDEIRDEMISLEHAARHYN